MTNGKKKRTKWLFLAMNCKQELEKNGKIVNFGRFKRLMMKLKNIEAGWIIHIFALLHACVTWACKVTGIHDELLLTVLTMTMVLLVCMKRWISIEFTASCVIVTNIIGYLLGTIGAELLQLILGDTQATNIVATFLTTEILGWTIFWISRLFRSRQTKTEEVSFTSPQMQWLLAAIFVIFALRIGIVLLMSTEPFINADVIGASMKVFSNSAALMIMIALNLLYIRLYEARIRARITIWMKPLLLIAFMVIVTLIETLLVGLRLPTGINPHFGQEFPMLFLTALLAEVTVYCIVYMINYAFTARSEAKQAKGMADLAEYRYLKLKHQVNPHFLFNSLNILDCLVCEEKNEQASTYIHKLAGLYRYMLKTEDEQLVSLREELDFAQRYYDLLKVRFPEGLTVETSIPEEYMSRSVLPCTLQLLIENATKHNTVNPSRPLVIRITAHDDSVCVCNEIIPKVSKSPSTGLGLRYMKQQYLDLSGREVDIRQTEESFCVTIPLL